MENKKQKCKPSEICFSRLDKDGKEKTSCFQLGKINIKNIDEKVLN